MIGAGLGAAALVGCSPSGSDYKGAAEDLIEEEISEQAGVGELTASCDDPPEDPAVGDTFACTGTTADGAEIEFVATVAEDDKVEVVSTNLLTAENLATIEEIAVAALEQEVQVTLGVENFDCGDEPVVLEPAAGSLVCALTDPSSGDVYDATVDIPDLGDLSSLTVQVADQPRSG